MWNRDKWLVRAWLLATVATLGCLPAPVEEHQNVGVSASAASPCAPGAVTDSVVEQYGEELTVQLSKALGQGSDAVGLSAKELRKAPGVASVSRELSSNPERMMRGTHNNAGLIPHDVAEQLNGQEFRSFGDFRSDFWKTVSDSPRAREFDGINGNLEAMRAGRAPKVGPEQSVGLRDRYEIHHIQPIHQGGSVYDMSNLVVVTPRFHKEVLLRTYHYGS